MICAEDIYEPNDSVSEAVNLDARGEGPWFGQICPGNMDYYSFDVAAPSRLELRVTFNHSIGDIDLELRDASENIVRSGGSSTNNEVITIDQLDPGRYYIELFGFGGQIENSYTINLSLIP